MDSEEKRRLSKNCGLIFTNPDDLPDEFKKGDALFKGPNKLHGFIYDKTFLRAFPKKYKIAGRLMLDIASRFRVTETVEYAKTRNGDIVEIPVLKVCQSRPAVLLQTKIWAEEEGCTIRTIQMQIKYLEDEGYLETFYKGAKRFRYFKPDFDKMQQTVIKMRLDLLNDPKTKWISFSKSTKEQERASTTKSSPKQTLKDRLSGYAIGRKKANTKWDSFSDIDNSNINNTRINSSKNTSYSSQNYINKANSANSSTKPKLKLRKNKKSNLAKKTKQPAKNKKLKLRTKAQRLKDAALYTEPVDLRPEKKNKPIKRVPKKVEKCLNYWNGVGLRQHRIDYDNPTKTLRESIRSLKQLLSGNAFNNGHVVDPKFKGKVFTVQDWIKAVGNFGKCTVDPNYQNNAKHYGKKLSIPDFIYRQDFPDPRKSHFCFNLEFEPKKAEPPKYFMPKLIKDDQENLDDLLKLLRSEYRINHIEEKDKVMLALLVRDFRIRMVNLAKQKKLTKTFEYVFLYATGIRERTEQIMKFITTQWAGPPHRVPLEFITHPKRIERLYGCCQKLGWAN